MTTPENITTYNVIDKRGVIFAVVTTPENTTTYNGLGKIERLDKL